MPLYDYQCERTTCGKRSEHFAHYRDESTRPCECGGAAHRLPAFLSAPNRAPRPDREWDEKEGRSQTLFFDPAGIKELKKEAPSIELDAEGHAVFRSSRHQRKVYREIQRTKDRYAEEERQKAEQAQEQGRLEDAAAAKAIADAFGVPQETSPCTLPIEPPKPPPTPLSEQLGLTPRTEAAR